MNVFILYQFSFPWPLWETVNQFVISRLHQYSNFLWSCSFLNIQSVCETCRWSYQQEVMVFRLCPQIFEDDLLHEPLHQVPVLHDPVTDRPLATRRGNGVHTSVLRRGNSQRLGDFTFVAYEGFSMASSPMKKSRSSTPLIILRCAWSPTLADSLIAIPGEYGEI